jgi:hypothetical protein
MFYSSDIRPDKFQAKDNEFKNLYNEVLKKFDSQLKSISTFYLELLNVQEETILDDVGESDSFYFSDELAFVGQHIVAVGSEKLKEPSKDIEDIEGEKLLKLFLTDNPSLQDLKIPIPELAFPVFQIPVANNNNNSDDKSTSSISTKSKKSSSTGRKDSKAKK